MPTPPRLIPIVSSSNGNVLFTYTYGNKTDVITISLSGGITSYTNVLNAQNQERHRWGTRLILYAINNASLFQQQILNNFLYFNNSEISSAGGQNGLSIGSRVLSTTTLQNRAEVIMKEKDMPGSTGIVDVIYPVPAGAGSFVITQNIFQSYIGIKKHKPSSRWGDVYNLMAHAAGDMYITITRTTNFITNEAGIALPLPYCLFGVNDYNNAYTTLMEQQLNTLNNSL